MKPDSIFRTTSIVILISLFILFIFDYFSLSLKNVSDFLKFYDAVFLSLGTIVTVGLIAIYTTYLGSKSSEKSRKADRIMQSELKIAEFRQRWIDDQRADIAEFTSLALHRKDGKQLIELTNALNRIKLRLNKINPEEKDRVERLEISLQEIMDARGAEETEKQIEASERIILVANEFLKLEWDRLKRDLHNARGLNVVE